MVPNETTLEQVHITTIVVDANSYDVTAEIARDEIEYRGRLRFTDEAWAEDDGVADFGALTGRSVEEIVAYARSLSHEELIQRYRRAVAEKRRYHGLRRLTDEFLHGIRYLNQVATSMRAGLLDMEEAAAEIDETETRLHQMVNRLRHVAGVVS